VLDYPVGNLAGRQECVVDTQVVLALVELPAGIELVPCVGFEQRRRDASRSRFEGFSASRDTHSLRFSRSAWVASSSANSTRAMRTRMALFIAKRARRSRKFGWAVLACRSPDQLGLITLSGIVVAPYPFRDWRVKPNAAGERRR
jgi:hypothetical protein